MNDKIRILICYLSEIKKNLIFFKTKFWPGIAVHRRNIQFRWGNFKMIKKNRLSRQVPQLWQESRRSSEGRGNIRQENDIYREKWISYWYWDSLCKWECSTTRLNLLHTAYHSGWITCDKFLKVLKYFVKRFKSYSS